MEEHLGPSLTRTNTSVLLSAVYPPQKLLVLVLFFLDRVSLYIALVLEVTV